MASTRVSTAGRWVRRSDWWLLAATVVVATVLVAIGLVQWRRTTTPSTGAHPEDAVVVRTVDGDTLIARIGGSEERVRLIGIDTPESVAPDRPVECYGHEASDHLAELLPVGTTVHLARDVEPRDRYDRLLAYVYRAEDGLLVNREQVAGGYAEAQEYPPNTSLAGDLEAVEASARAAHAGMWGAC